MNTIYSIFQIHPIWYSYLIIINVVTLLIFGFDKLFSITGNRRIREKVLLIMALVGGTPGTIIGMILFRHKISKDAFLVPLALIIILQVIVSYIIVRNFFPTLLY